MDEMKPILLVDDDSVEHYKAKRTFKKLGFKNNLITKSDGVEALEYLQQCEILPAFILLDLNMPRMNGLELLSILKADDRFKVIPVLIMTTSDNERERTACYEQSVAGYMVKPIYFEDYERQLETIKMYWSESRLGH